MKESSQIFKFGTFSESAKDFTDEVIQSLFEGMWQSIIKEQEAERHGSQDADQTCNT